MTEPLLRAQGIYKAFAGVQALKDVSLTIAPGEIHCLAGENGCGKSTLIKIISGVYHQDAGFVEFCRKKVQAHCAARSHQRGYSGDFIRTFRCFIT